MQEAFAELSLRELVVADDAAVAVKHLVAILHDHLADTHLVFFGCGVFDHVFQEEGPLAQVVAICDVDYLDDVEDFELVAELELALLVKLLEVELFGVESVEEEVFAFPFGEEVIYWPVKDLLDLFESVRSFFPEQVNINAPILQFHIKHAFILLLLFV